MVLEEQALLEFETMYKIFVQQNACICRGHWPNVGQFIQALAAWFMINKLDETST